MRRNPQNNDTSRKTATSESGKEFVYDASKKLDGVIAHLTRECGGNGDGKGRNRSCHCTQCSWHHYGKNALEAGPGPCDDPTNEPDSWIFYDFKDQSDPRTLLGDILSSPDLIVTRIVNRQELTNNGLSIGLPLEHLNSSRTS